MTNANGISRAAFPLRLNKNNSHDHSLSIIVIVKKVARVAEKDGQGEEQEGRKSESEKSYWWDAEGQEEFNDK